MDEAASKLAMELESVPTEIDEVQRRLMQLELASRQLAEETEESTAVHREEIEAEMAQLKRNRPPVPPARPLLIVSTSVASSEP